ncbi:hypothetical protein [Oecophyllibacter saccharovorans]|uniref:hypothetical protein n=1 Tax=Oecophyllibacter saccharovorans TaxID=2558360 RepID=UPI00116D752F|nr:hypothetical protein [Oecophyllibacter saccharovorans]TPW35132.1 hypothetical protein E3203_06610 [Oecophyllibacter saccharovorans]
MAVYVISIVFAEPNSPEKLLDHLEIYDDDAFQIQPNLWLMDCQDDPEAIKQIRFTLEFYGCISYGDSVFVAELKDKGHWTAIGLPMRAFGWLGRHAERPEPTEYYGSTCQKKLRDD